MPAAQWSVPATVENVPKLRQQAVRYAREHEVQEPPIGDLALALGEAIANVVVHAFRTDEPGTMTVSMSIEPTDNEVKVLVADDGIGFQPNPNSPGLGMGMPLITTLAEPVAVRSPPGGRGTEVHMTFRLPVAET